MDVRSLSDPDLLTLELETLWNRDANDRLRRASLFNDGPPPDVVVAVSPGAPMVAFGPGVPEHFAREIEDLVGLSWSSETPRLVEDICVLLTRQLGQIGLNSGPSYVFDNAPAVPALHGIVVGDDAAAGHLTPPQDANWADSEWEALLAGRLGPWAAAVVGRSRFALLLRATDGASRRGWTADGGAIPAARSWSCDDRGMGSPGYCDRSRRLLQHLVRQPRLPGRRGQPWSSPDWRDLAVLGCARLTVPCLRRSSLGASPVGFANNLPREPRMTSPQQPIEIPPPSLDDVLYEKRDGWALITLNRPVVLNAINWSILRRLKVALDQAEADGGVKAVVLTGAGRAFSAGGDIQSTPPPDNDPTPSGFDINMQIWRMPKPVIAAVRGYAVGQGHELAGMCDLTIAAEDATFGELQIRHGFAPPILVTPFLVGLKQAKEILMMGERIDAREALRLGLVNRVVPNDELLSAAEGMVKRLGALPQHAVRSNKLLVNRAYELAGFQDALGYRHDPVMAEIMKQRGELDPNLKILREQGWEAFRKSRDANYEE